MNASFKFTPVLFILGLVSCGDNSSIQELIADKDTQTLTERKAKIQEQLNVLNDSLALYNSALEEINPNKNIVIIKDTIINPSIFESFVDVQSSVIADQDVQVSPEFAGSMRLFVREGQHVGAGQIIATINDGGLNQQLQQAKIQSDLARTVFIKQSKLWEQKIGSEMQYLQAKSTYDASLKSISALQATIKKTNVLAPFSGVIDKIITESGQIVGPGMPIVRLIGTGRMKIEAQIPETYLTDIQMGSKVMVELPSINQTIDTRISRISTAINPNNRTFTATIFIPSGSLIKPNLRAALKIRNYINPSAYKVPSNTIREDSQGQKFVFVTHMVKGQLIAKKTPVQVGKMGLSETEIVSGLKSGDKVVIEGFQKLTDQEIVRK